jgi:hypothetical protein
MAGTERPDVSASTDADERDSLPALENGEIEADRALPSADEDQPSVPATGDESGPVAIGSGGTHELLEPQPNSERTVQPEPSSSQLVSGDPLLVAPALSKAPPAEPKVAKPPPPPAANQKRRPSAPAPPAEPAASRPVSVSGIAVPSTGQPAARRASRGAHVATPTVARPPTRPPEQPVATLRPTTVAPVPRIAGRRPRVRRVTRVVRQVDPWSVFKVAAAFSIVAYAIALIAGVLLWNVAYATGTIDNIERGMESTGWEVFELDGGEIFHNAWIGGLFGAVAMTGLAVLTATLFNLITDLVGGIRLTVLEEEVIEKTSSPMRRFATAPARRPAGAPDASTGQGAEARVRRARGG